MDSVKLKELIEKNKYSVNDLLSGLLPKSKIKHITSILAERLNKKGVKNSRGGSYFATSVQNSLYYPDRVDLKILDEVINYIIENGVSVEQIEDFQLESV